ncbi:MAG: fibronectin type III domain-containing protein [Gammaproteobacteria bacterium]
MKSSPKFSLLLRICLTVFISLCFAACNNLNDLHGNNSSGTDFSIGVSANSVVGTQTVTESKIEINGQTNSEAIEALNISGADFTLDISASATYPVIISTVDGTNVVTGLSEELTLHSVIMSENQKTANLNSLSTIIAKTAQAMPGGLTDDNFALANQYVQQSLNFGLDTQLIENAVTSTVNENNVAALVKASESFSESLRRTISALQIIGLTVTLDDLVEALAADLIDGYLDGSGGEKAKALYTATTLIVAGQVIIEALSNNLALNQIQDNGQLDNAVKIMVPATETTIEDVSITPELLIQLRHALNVAKLVTPGENISTLMLALNTLDAGQSAAEMGSLLPPSRGAELNDAITLASLTINIELSKVYAMENIAAPSDSNLTLAWNSPDQNIIGYIVYYGDSPLTASSIVSETNQSAITFDVDKDLGLKPGDNLCLRLKAYNQFGLSDFSGAACMVL